MTKIEDTYGCDICGKRGDWDGGIVWVTSEVGVCNECYDKLATGRCCNKCGETVFVNREPEAVKPYRCLVCDEPRSIGETFN